MLLTETHQHAAIDPEPPSILGRDGLSCAIDKVSQSTKGPRSIKDCHESDFSGSEVERKINASVPSE